MKGISIVLVSVACVSGLITAIAGGIIAATAAGLPMYLGVGFVVLGLGVIGLAVFSVLQ